MILGAIADDLTGASDLALTLAREGMRTIQTVGLPLAGLNLAAVDAVVISMKSRTNPAEEAVEMSLAALDWLKKAGARQILFKYCSTFDSTADGNIGPVTQALMGALATDLTVVCPAFPVNGRTIYKGHLFVGNQLLSDSPMRHHPLTPMTDSSLIRLMQQQTSLKVGLIAHDIVSQGAAAIKTAFGAARANGEQILVLDALADEDLRSIGLAVEELPLLTGGSGIAIGLPENFRRAGLLPKDAEATQFDAPTGHSAILAGSCSHATRLQIAEAISAGNPSLKIEPDAISVGTITVEQAVEWAVSQISGIPLLYSSADPEEVKKSQARFGREQAGLIIENFFADMAVGLRNRGFRRLIIAGGETSGAVVGALSPGALLIGPEIDPGVPWTLTIGEGEPMALALKSGNFGASDFFRKAWRLLT